MNTHSDENFLSVPREKDGYVYMGPYKQWEVNIWGFSDRGIGDLWYNTLRMIILTDDKSDWAVSAFATAESHLILGLRWPDIYNNEHISKNRIQYEWTKLLYKLKLRKTRMYRPQTSITRDPWIMLYCCAVHIGIDPSTLSYPQWYLYRPKVWQWIRALKGKRNIYPLLDKLTPKKRKDFVYVLDEYMRKAVNGNFS